MAAYNGLLSSLTRGTTTGGGQVLTGLSYTQIVDAMPQKWFNRAIFAVQSKVGHSGSFAVSVVSSINGATFVIAGRTGIGAVGSFVLGSSSALIGVPKPAYVQWASAIDASGFTASVSVAGDYE